MSASVRMEDESFSDVRYEVLANSCGLADSDHARGKMAKLWRQCTQQQSYVLHESIVVAVLGPNGVAGVIESGLGQVVDGGVRIRGTKGRIEWLGKLRKNAAKGGRAKAAKRQSGGRKEAAKELPPPCPPAPAPAPAPAPIPEEIYTGPALPEVVSSAPPRTRERHPEAGRVARAVYGHAAVAASALRTKNVQLQPWPAHPDAFSVGWTELLNRAESMLVRLSVDDAIALGKRRVDVAVATAIRDGSGQYFAPAVMFSAKSFEIGAAMDPQQIANQRAGPGGAGKSTDGIRPTRLL